MKSISNSSLILIGMIAASLGACSKGASPNPIPKSSTIIVRNNAPTLVTVRTAGSPQPLAPADSVSFTGIVGQVFPIEIKLESFGMILTSNLSPTFTDNKQVFPFNVDSGVYFLRIVNNSTTYYGNVHVFSAMDLINYPVSLYPSYTKDVAYFHSAGDVQISIGQDSSDPNPIVFKKGIDFTLPNTDNQVLTLVIN